MKPWHLAAAALVILLVVFILSLLFPYVPPINPAEHFTQEEIARGASYSRVHFIGWVVSLFLTFAVYAAIYMTKIGDDLSSLTERITGENPRGWKRLLEIVVYRFLLFFLFMIVFFPIAAVRGYVVPTRFSLGAPSFGSWFLYSWLPGSFIALMNALFIAVVVFGLMRRFPRAWWIIATVVLFSIGILFGMLSPVTVDKLANNFTPLEDGPMRDKITAFAKKAGMPLPPIFVVDKSKTTKHTNAYYTGIGPTKRIVLYDTLVEKNEVESVESIMAHEAGHWKHSHIMKGILIGVPGGILAILLIVFLFQFLAKQPFFRLNAIHDVRAIPLFLFCVMVVQYAQMPVFNYISRQFEIQADATSIELTGRPEAFIKAEVDLVRDNASDVYPHSMAIFWFASHPPAMDRIAMGVRALENMKSEK
jgi:STE24 endopeptidase